MTRELPTRPGVDATTGSASRPDFEERIASGRRIIDTAFGQSASHRMPAGTRVFAPESGSAPVYRLSGGWACRAVDWPDGRRAILEIYLPGDIIGLEAAVLGHPADEVVAATALTLQVIDGMELAELMADPAAALAISWLLAEQQRRVDRLAAALARRDAHERLALMLTDLYDRLSRRDLINSSSYALPLTQRQIGDHLGLTLVHVDRALCSLRENGIIGIDRHVVTIHDLDRLRQLTTNGHAEQPLSTEPSRAPRELMLDCQPDRCGGERTPEPQPLRSRRRA